MKLNPQDLQKIAANTLGYYDQRAEDFREGTRDHDVSQNIAALLQQIGFCASARSSRKTFPDLVGVLGLVVVLAHVARSDGTLRRKKDRRASQGTDAVPGVARNVNQHSGFDDPFFITDHHSHLPFEDEHELLLVRVEVRRGAFPLLIRRDGHFDEFSRDGFPHRGTDPGTLRLHLGNLVERHRYSPGQRALARAVGFVLHSHRDGEAASIYSYRVT